MKLAISYLRMSSRKQIKGDSHRRQTAAIQAGREWAEREGYTLDESYVLEDIGFSAWKRTNLLSPKAALAAFLSDVRKGRVPRGTVLILESLDRLTRTDMDEALSLFLELLRAGIGLKTFDPDRLYTQADLKINPMLALMEPIIIFARANEESKVKSSRIRKVFQAKRDDAEKTYMPGRIPAWIEVLEDGSGYRENKDKADIVRRIFKLASRGQGINAIARTLNSEGVPPIGLGKHWSTSYVSKILHSRHVLGEFQPCKLLESTKVFEGKEVIEVNRVPDGEVRKSHFPQVISEEVFYRVQSSLSKRKTVKGRTPTEVNIFQGLLYCGNIGDESPLYIGGRGRATAQRPDVRRLISAKSLEGVAGACTKQIDYPALEDSFLHYCREVLRPEDFREDSGTGDRIAEISGRLVSIETRIARTQKLIDTADDDDAYESFVRQLAKLEAQRKGLLEDLEVAKAEHTDRHAESVGDLKGLAETLEGLAGEERQALLLQVQARVRQLIQRINLIAEDLDSWRRCTCQITFHHGGEKYFGFEYCLRPRHYEVRRRFETAIGEHSFASLMLSRYEQTGDDMDLRDLGLVTPEDLKKELKKRGKGKKLA